MNTQITKEEYKRECYENGTVPKAKFSSHWYDLLQATKEGVTIAFERTYTLGEVKYFKVD